jgi:hypothetical protein
MVVVKIFLNFPGEFAGDLADDLFQQMVTTALHQSLGQEVEHRGQSDPYRQIQLPAHQGVGHESVHFLVGNLHGPGRVQGLDIGFVKTS